MNHFPLPPQRRVVFCCSLFFSIGCARCRPATKERCEKKIQRRGGNSASFRPEQPSQVKARTKAPSQKKTFPRRRPPAVVLGKKISQCDQEGILRKYKFLFEWQAGVFESAAPGQIIRNTPRDPKPCARCRDERAFLLRRAAYEKLASNSTGESAFVPLEFAQTAFAPGSESNRIATSHSRSAEMVRRSERFDYLHAFRPQIGRLRRWIYSLWPYLV